MMSRELENSDDLADVRANTQIKKIVMDQK